MKTRTVLFWAACLFMIDQMVKIVIDKHFLDVRFEIIPPVFYFQPTFNDKYSWINSLFGLGMGFRTHIILFCSVAVIFVVFYSIMKAASGNAKLMNIAFIFGFAGMISSLIGTIVWNGCLDYIYMKPLFVFDLKDLYINCFVVLILIFTFKNKQQLSAFKTSDIIRYFKNRKQNVDGTGDADEHRF